MAWVKGQSNVVQGPGLSPAACTWGIPKQVCFQKACWLRGREAHFALGMFLPKKCFPCNTPLTICSSSPLLTPNNQ